MCVCVCERERERDAEQGDRVTVLRTVALMILKLVNPLESLEDRITIHMNRFLRAPLVFSSSSLKQRTNVSPRPIVQGALWSYSLTSFCHPQPLLTTLLVLNILWVLNRVRVTSHGAGQRDTSHST